MARNVARIQLDRAGISEVAKSREMQTLMHDLAERIADNVRGQGIRVDGVPGKHELPVKVTDTVTDRARSSVTIAHPSGKAVQAKHGALTRAAAEAGLEVSS